MSTSNPSSQARKVGDEVILDMDGSQGKKYSLRAGMPIVIKNLSYTVPQHGDKKKKISLLKNLDGVFEKGTMTALMGPSGSGKTTLLDVLAGRKTAGESQGVIKFSGRQPSKPFLRRYTGYVEQFDTLIPVLTVREMLMYTAEMKCGDDSYATKTAIVEGLLDKLALRSCQDIKIGDPLTKGISGGQSKRVNIGIAMVSEPRVLFLDEPTSGLDSYTANEVMTVIKGLAKDGTTVLATIHSPSPYCFALFDSMYMLVSGECVYHGPNSDIIMNYFKHECGVEPEKTSAMDVPSNNADYITYLIVSADRQKRAHEYAVAYESSAMKKNVDRRVNELLQEDTKLLDTTTLAALNTSRGTSTPAYKGLYVYMKYRTRKSYTDPTWLAPRIADKIVMTTLMGTLYWGVGTDFSVENLQNITGVLFMWSVMPAFAAAAYLPSIVLEKPLYVRERSDGVYRPITYLVAKLLDELILLVPVSVLASLALWFMVSLQGSFLTFWVTYFMQLCIGIVLAYSIAVLAPNLEVATAVMPMLGISWLFFSGFLIRSESQPSYWSWYRAIVPVSYTFKSQLRNQFNDRDPLIAGDLTVTEFYSADGAGPWENIGYLALFFLAFFLIALLALQFKKQSSR